MEKQYYAYKTIITKYIGATNTRPTRIKASCGEKPYVRTKTISYPDADSPFAAHQIAAKALMQDIVQINDIVTGFLPNGDYVHVLLPLRPFAR